MVAWELKITVPLAAILEASLSGGAKPLTLRS